MQHEPGPDLAHVVMSAAVGMAVTDLRGRVVRVNDAFARLLHVRGQDLLGRELGGLLRAVGGAEGAVDLEGVVEELLAGTPTVTAELLVRRADGTALRGQAVCSLARSAPPELHDGGRGGGSPVVLVQLVDADQRGRGRGSDHDPLTRLRSRSGVVADLTNRLASRSGLLGVLAVDLDRFRVVNESYDHAVGDQVLVGIARRLLAGVRGGDSVARLGDDEFLVVLDGLTDGEEAADVARRLTRSLAAPLSVDTEDGPQELRRSVSTGLVVVDLQAPPAVGAGSSPQVGRGTTPPLDAATLLRDANTALDAAKAAGGGCCRLFTDAMRERAVRRLTLENDLRRALERGELRVHYQPVVSLRDGHRTGFEALVRWAHPSRGLLLPGQFLDVAEDCGLVTAIDAVVLEEALEFLARHPEVRVAVNTSARRLDGTFAASVARGLRRRGLDPSLLAVELLETSLVSGDAVTEQELRDLHELGVAVLLDDFGTGYSALSYLRRLPVSGLKLDRSFVADLPEDTSSDRIAAAVVSLAGSFELSSTCEGVETPAQAAHVRAQGWQHAQGFHFGVPAPEERWFPRTCAPAGSVRVSA
ncbi:putative bifunctional diguanylate cyclase/phosphodiesterase [Kineococcus sp. SYSU DK003]|uniref:putative bifunctional diguanylate cyclase/phosphodiesterase n=1 Tax=Kineococcus sp. SYSU DK003 TaxID=3383124 RepID=UPI003D7D3121